MGHDITAIPWDSLEMLDAFWTLTTMSEEAQSLCCVREPREYTYGGSLEIYRAQSLW